MDICVCVKRVPGTGSTILLTDDGMNVDTRHLGFTIGPHEECAVEEAVQIVTAHGGSVTVLTAGPPEAEEQLRYALSLGADRGVLIDTGPEELDAEQTASALTQAIRQLESGGSRFDMLLFGNESADASHYQVGIRVACALELPMVGGVKGIQIDEAAGTLDLRRDAAGGIEVYRTPLPAAVAVAEGLNLPRYPSMRGRLRAMKARLDTVEVQLEPGGLRKRGLRRPAEQGSQTVMLGTGPEAADAVADVLEELGVV
ncbi:electron transfer flavoprotein beta subunit [Haloactinopolyspora alba]|uniref:Electron transfer flavoprotein beta subunit n=2 Tax=Haloactinopolyspora alba TaxID=648780 RepID=A0A2P8DIC6_9ACTN|nr:electron transfer flavoprotein subunit beta/FixA family protein [Haloactinopolyspora alba]PSK96972.1 electron transfer flavoprotein beta subunit [Haloactinopolyspora alba]